MARRKAAASAIDAFRQRRDGLARRLRTDSPQVFEDQKHLDAGTVERAYWHYGYLVALRDVIGLLDERTTKH